MGVLRDLSPTRQPTPMFGKRNIIRCCLLVVVLVFTYHLCIQASFEGWNDYTGLSDDSAGESDCEPWTEPSHLLLNPQQLLSTYLQSYNPECQATHSWITKIQQSLMNKSSIPELENKELLLVGDSVDRRVLFDLCNKTLGMEVVIHPIDSFKNRSPIDIGGLPRTCTIPHLNLTMSNFFFYGFDEKAMWKGLGPYVEPGKYTERFEVFEQAIKTLPSGGNPDLVIANVGLWELLRHHAQMEHATPVDPLDLTPDFQRSFLNNTVTFLRNIRKAVGPQTRIRFRENHTPGTDENNFFTSEAIAKGEKRIRYTGVRIDTINALVNEALRRVNFEDDIRLWPVGRAMRPWPSKMWVEDDCHPKPGVLASVWGEGMLEYVARAPRVSEKVYT